MSGFATVPGAHPLRVVVVGAGAMGRAWIRTVLDTASVELVGLVDLDVALATGVTEDLPPIAVGDSLERVARDSGAQAVIDVTVPPAHHAVNTEALLLGLPVLCEKPIAPTVAEALSLAAASELTGQLLMTSQSRRYYPELADFRAIGATLGGVGMLSTDFFRAPHFGGFRDEMEHPLLVDMAIHSFDAARYVLDDEPVRVDCRSFNPAWSWYRGDAAANAVFEFAGGARYVYTGSWCSPGLETSWNGRWRMSGADGAATWDGEASPEVEYTAGEHPRRAAPRPIRREIAGALDEFVDALRTGTEPSGAVRANIQSLAMVEGAVRSAETGSGVDIADLLDEAYRVAIDTERRADVREVLLSWGSPAPHRAGALDGTAVF